MKSVWKDYFPLTYGPIISIFLHGSTTISPNPTLFPLFLPQLFGTDQDAMLESLEQGDVAETVRIFFEQSRKVKPAKKGCLSLQQVDSFLEELSKMTREDDQVYHFEQICSQWVLLNYYYFF